MPVQKRIRSRKANTGYKSLKAYHASFKPRGGMQKVERFEGSHRIERWVPSRSVMHGRVKQLAKSLGKGHPKTRAYARKVNRYNLIAAGGGSSSRSEAARKAWVTRRGH
jgi:hypothetical protein